MTTDDPIRQVLQTAEHAANFVREKLGDLQKELDNRPQNEDPLTSVRFRTWDRRTMMKLGMVQGALHTLQAFGLLPPEQYNKLRWVMLGMVSRTAAKVDMGPSDI